MGRRLQTAAPTTVASRYQADETKADRMKSSPIRKLTEMVASNTSLLARKFSKNSAFMKRVNSDSSLSSCASFDDASNCCSQDEGKKAVTFGNLEIREYDIVIGDHPCCTSGLPLSLGWDYTEHDILPVDEYEACRSRSLSGKELRRLPSHERKEMLEERYSATELRHAERRVHRSRAELLSSLSGQKQQHLHLDGKAKFFGL